MMKKTPPAPNPAAYVAALAGWRQTTVRHLRSAVRGAAKTEEAVKWGHLVYSSNGPALLIRTENDRVLFGFWRGKRLRELERRLKLSGKSEMATIELRERESITTAAARRLVKQAVALNRKLGDPRLAGQSA